MIQYMETETSRLLKTAVLDTLMKTKAEAIKAKTMKQVYIHVISSKRWRNSHIILHLVPICFYKIELDGE